MRKKININNLSEYKYVELKFWIKIIFVSSGILLIITSLFYLGYTNPIDKEISYTIKDRQKLDSILQIVRKLPTLK